MRARNIKPGFFENEALGECSFPARLLFAGLWLLCDREGYMKDRPKRIKGELFRFDSIDVEPLLAELAAGKLIERYEVDGERYLFVPGFLKHQKPHHKEQPSLIPKPGKGACQHAPRCVPVSPEFGILNPESLNPEPLKDGVMEAQKLPDPSQAGYYPDKFGDAREVAAEYVAATGTSHDPRHAINTITVMLGQGVKKSDLIAAAKHWGEECRAKYSDPAKRQSAKNFYGGGDWQHYVEDRPVLPMTAGPPPVPPIVAKMMAFRAENERQRAELAREQEAQERQVAHAN